MKEAARRFGWAGVALILGLCAFWALMLIIAPLGVMISESFRPNLPPAEWGGPKDVFTLQNYKIVLMTEVNRAIFIKTIWASVLVTVLSLAIGYPISYIMARGGKAGWVGLMMLGLLIPFWVNEIVRTFAWQMILARMGPINMLLEWVGLIEEPIRFLNSDFGVMVGLVYAYLLFMVFPLYSAMESLDPNQIEAARDLGAPYWRIHWDIVAPHSKPGIASGCIVVFMAAAGSFVAPVLLGGTRSLWFTQLIYNQFDGLNWPAGAAYGFTLVMLCLVFITLVMALFKVRLTDIAK